LFLALSTHDRYTSISGVVLGVLALLVLVSRPRVIRPDLRLLREVVRSECQDAGLRSSAAAMQYEISSPGDSAVGPVTAVPSDLLFTLLTLAVSGRQVRARVTGGSEFLYVTGLRRDGESLMVGLSASATASATDSWYDLGAITELDTDIEGQVK
jgi:hypothetical protein